MSLWSKKEKVCASCIYWNGKRTIDLLFIETKNCEGKCSYKDGFYDLKTIQGSSCLSWKGFSSGKVKFESYGSIEVQN